MAFSKVVAIVFALVAASEASGASALMYIVGEAQGWTFNVDYNAWASNKNFVPGDVLVFQYNPQAHSVFSVSQGDYNSCNLGSPLASYASGNDQVTLSQPGSYYFLCGTPGHCQGGMKVAVTVGGGSGSTSTTPTTPSTPSGTPTTPSVTPTTPSLTPTTPSVTPSTPAVTCAPNAPSPPSTFPMDPSRRAAAAAGVPCYSFQLSVFLATLVFGAIDLLN